MIKFTHKDVEYRVTLYWPNEDDFEFSLVESRDMGRPETRGAWTTVYSGSNKNQEDVGDLLEELHLVVLEHEDLPRDYAEYLADREAYFAELAYDIQREDK